MGPHRAYRYPDRGKPKVRPMNIVLPILFGAVLLGLFAPPRSKAVWWIMLLIIAAVITKTYVKGV